MIDVSNLKDALETLGFVAHGDIHEKVFPEIGCSLKVDFQAKRLIYPNEIKGRERNDGFDQKENFVVFECVCRLLSKGYRPEHIELEKEWHLGHDPKGGRADICVTDTSGNMLFIIECKTWGKAYDKALNNTKNDGAQLFSYWQQEQSCKWLVLYASDLKGGCIVHKASTIDCSDDANIVLLSKKDKSIKLYRDANTASAKYEAWKETYGRQIHDDLIFSKDSVAYQIGVKPLRKKDLRDFTPDDKIVNKFEEILRHNNVSDKENAFNRLVALFICKLVDESIKDEDDEVEFQYKQGTDTYAYSIEREKLFYFSLVYQQTTVIITAPADNKAQKEFLGYDWSNRKGNEGIQIITPGGKMYDDADRVAQGTLAHSIKKSFDGMAPSFNEEQATYASVVNTKNMLDYSRVNFNKALRTSVKKAFHISSKYPLVKLASVCDLNTSKTEIHDTPDDLLVSFIDMASVSSEGFIERKVDCPYGEVRNGGYTYFAEGDFIIAKITPCMENGKCAIAEGLTNGIGFGSSEFHTFRCHASEILTKFLFLLLNQTTVRKAAEDAMTGASGHRRVPAAFYEEMLIPVPPIPVQQQVIDECAKIDEEYNATRMRIETYRQKTADLFAELDAVMSTTEGNRLSLSDTEKFSVAIGKRVLDKELASNGTIPVYSANVTAPFGFIDKLLITDFSAPSVLWGIDGDWMTSYLPSDMPFYPTDHCGVLRCKNSEVNPRYLAHILEVEGRKMGFSRSYRASIDRVHGIAFTVPDISIQNNAMSKVADYEMAIKELEGSLEKIDSRRSEIIRKALAE